MAKKKLAKATTPLVQWMWRNPEVAGWYWAERCSAGQDDELRIVEFVQTANGVMYFNGVYADGSAKWMKPITRFQKIAGPIPMPTHPPI